MEIAEIFSIERISLCDDLRSKKTVLERLGSLLEVKNAGPSASQIGDLLASRERLGTTGLGGGIALPHAKIAKKEPARAAFLKISNPIDFDAVDEKPVDLFLGLCLPEDSINEYLNLLGKVAEALEDISFVENLRIIDDKEVVLRRLSREIDSKQGV